MANNIELAKKYTPLIDEKYKKESFTSILNSPASMVRLGENTHTILYRHVSVNGLGNYSRNSGYTNNAVTVEWKSAEFNYDRGTKITMDEMDNEETLGDSYLVAQNELQTSKVAPEGDAFTFATIAGTPDITIATEGGETFADGEDFLNAVLKGVTKMDEEEVPSENRILFATPTLINSIMALDTTKSREVLDSFSQIVKVPQSRFYTKIKLLDGTTKGEEIGHYEKAEDGNEINFMIVHKDAILKWDKHIVRDAISPASNPSADAYIAKYRKYGIVHVFEEKKAGVYVSFKANA